jgi:hypothetical protein
MRQIRLAVSLWQRSHEVIDNRPGWLVGRIRHFHVVEIDLHDNLVRFKNERRGVARTDRPKDDRFLIRQVELSAHR